MGDWIPGAADVYYPLRHLFTGLSERGDTSVGPTPLSRATRRSSTPCRHDRIFLPCCRFPPKPFRVQHALGPTVGCRFFGCNILGLCGFHSAHIFT